jgi:hypothetical protein
MQQAIPVSKGRLWAGRIISAIPIAMLLMSAGMKFLKPPSVLEGFAHYGYPESMITTIGVLELACIVAYAIPRTSVLGAILVAAYLGGATATNAHRRFCIPCPCVARDIRMAGPVSSRRQSAGDFTFTECAGSLTLSKFRIRSQEFLSNHGGGYA